MSKPLVSVIMPIYNCERFIHLALDSILSQTYENIELIVVDDHSSDGTWKILQEYAKRDTRIRALRNDENLKIVGTLNRAIEYSKGKYLSRMDGDDEKVADAIEAQVAYLESHSEIIVVGGAMEVCDEHMITLNTRHYPLTDKDVREKIFRYSPYAHGAIMMRASMLPPEPYKLNWAEDYDLYFRLGHIGKFANLDQVVYRLRTYKQSVSRTKARYQEKLTLYIRLKAVFEYGYKMTAYEKLYFFAQLCTMYIMPTEFRFWLFNRIRKAL